jgi:hypothetical protein
MYQYSRISPGFLFARWTVSVKQSDALLLPHGNNVLERLANVRMVELEAVLQSCSWNDSLPAKSVFSKAAKYLRTGS